VLKTINCEIQGCSRKIRARKLCSTHYNRMMKKGRLQKLHVFDGRCKDCEQPKIRIRSERRKSKTSFHYVDDRGRLWNGFVCPDCKNPKLLVNNKTKKRKESVDDDFIYC